MFSLGEKVLKKRVSKLSKDLAVLKSKIKKYDSTLSQMKKNLKGYAWKR